MARRRETSPLNSRGSDAPANAVIAAAGGAYTNATTMRSGNPTLTCSPCQAGTGRTSTAAIVIAQRKSQASPEGFRANSAAISPTAGTVTRSSNNLSPSFLSGAITCRDTRGSVCSSVTRPILNAHPLRGNHQLRLPGTDTPTAIGVGYSTVLWVGWVTANSVAACPPNGGRHRYIGDTEALRQRALR